MKKIFLENNINITDEQLNLLEKYYQLLIYYNEKFNITAITEKNEVFVKHFLDSIINLKKLTSEKVIDIGSGGGFPALPIKIFNSKIELTLLEATGKKCDFLNTVINELKLTTCNVINNRAEIVSHDDNFREKFDICTARAVARLNVLCEFCMPFVKVGGQFIAFKGEACDEELIEAENAIKTLGGKIEKVDKFELNGAKRALIYIKKVKTSPEKYPRQNGVIRKKPL